MALFGLKEFGGAGEHELAARSVYLGAQVADDVPCLELERGDERAVMRGIAEGRADGLLFAVHDQDPAHALSRIPQLSARQRQVEHRLRTLQICLQNVNSVLCLLERERAMF